MRIESALPDFLIREPQIVRRDNSAPELGIALEPQIRPAAAQIAPPAAQTEPMQAASAATQPRQYYGGGVIVEISQEAKDAYKQSKAQGPDGISGMQEIAKAGEIKECQTCKNRKYVDVSDDASVSFQTPAHISPGQAASRVMSHEQEHVANEQMKADREDRRVVSQTVTLSSGICPECGKVYISGGVTRTITAAKMDMPQVENNISSET